MATMGLIIVRAIDSSKTTESFNKNVGATQ
jgi:hypothetical protein